MTTTTKDLTATSAEELIREAAGNDPEPGRVGAWTLDDLLAASAAGEIHYLNRTLIGDFLFFRTSNGWQHAYLRLSPTTDPWA